MLSPSTKPRREKKSSVFTTGDDFPRASGNPFLTGIGAWISPSRASWAPVALNPKEEQTALYLSNVLFSSGKRAQMGEDPDRAQQGTQKPKPGKEFSSSQVFRLRGFRSFTSMLRFPFFDVIPERVPRTTVFDTSANPVKCTGSPHFADEGGDEARRGLSELKTRRLAARRKTGEAEPTLPIWLERSPSVPAWNLPLLKTFQNLKL